MEKNFFQLTTKFLEIKKLGYIKSTRSGTTGLGKTFEDLLKKKEDTLGIPDFLGIEIKTKLDFSNSYTCLFHSTPQMGNESAIKYLVLKYGYPDQILKNKKVFQNSVYANHLRKIGTKFLFILSVDKENEKIYLKVLDTNLRVLESNIYWSFARLKEQLSIKLKYLALVKAKKRTFNSINYYYYYDISYFQLKTFEDFLDLIEKEIIRVTFHIGVFRSSSRKGEIHDHGTSFEIQERNLDKLFDHFMK